MDLICVGDVMLDVRVDAAALARGGDVHGRVSLRPGGTSANAAVWAASTGASVRVHGRIGADVVGRMLRSELEAHGVDAALVEDPDAPTGTMLVVVEAGERSMVADRGANARLMPADLPEELRAGAVLVSGYLLLQEGAQEAGIEAIRRARTDWIAVETGTWPIVEALGADGFDALAKGASFVLANEREAEVLTGMGADGAVHALGERYRGACVKRGARGAVMVLDGRRHEAATEPVDAIDPTGAGDAFDGVLLASLGAGVDPDEALAAACRAGARVAAGPAAWPEVSA
jgi:sugar/nucleoside kinase (ribokinase family)